MLDVHSEILTMNVTRKRLHRMDFDILKFFLGIFAPSQNGFSRTKMHKTGRMD